MKKDTKGGDTKVSEETEETEVLIFRGYNISADIKNFCLFCPSETFVSFYLVFLCTFDCL